MWKEENFERLLRYWHGKSSPKEEVEIRQWLASEPESEALFDALKDYFETIRLEETTYDVSDKGYKRLSDKITDWEESVRVETDSVSVTKDATQKAMKSVSRKLSYKKILALAAVLAGFVFGGLYIWKIGAQASEQEKVVWMKKETGRKQQEKVALPDGSMVYLNVESRIKYNTNSFAQERTIYLEGEAFFEVTPDKKRPFRVVTSSLTTQVLGTSFNVQAYRNSMGSNYGSTHVTVATGKVRVVDSVQAELEQLLPGDELIYDNTHHSVQTRKVDLSTIRSWQNKRLIFRDTPIAEIVAQLERWYDVSIVIDNPALYSCHFTATFNQLTLQQTLELLSITTNLSYQQNGKTITLRGNACQ
ncbi:FecR family protein [Xanthocytophaga agilis]|uniref:DUF4974 domain-containing protein n=1 Tax=Xanthocytophaga agilis TaxID=3048010 RepID=A0AAE3UAU3_9BACT|nr:FecR domain-containing protein [Xanthocytophaga agilis]MDJ1499093.1 DUF4974 domain-containing protein [Xanthocytophaga agilis]